MSAYLDTICLNRFTAPCYVGDLEACKQQGEASGDQAFARSSNPYPKGSAEREWWEAGWLNSRDELCGEQS